MFDHLGFGVTDVAASKAFFAQAGKTTARRACARSTTRTTTALS